jgi:hypothetical protein
MHGEGHVNRVLFLGDRSLQGRFLQDRIQRAPSDHTRENENDPDYPEYGGKHAFNDLGIQQDNYRDDQHEPDCPVRRAHIFFHIEPRLLMGTSDSARNVPILL